MIEDDSRIYAQISEAYKDSSKRIEFLDDRYTIEKVLSNFGPMLDPRQATGDLTELYSVAFHPKSKSLVIANRGAVLYCISPKRGIPYLVFHQGIAIYRPDLGLEMVNTGITGDIYNAPVIVRAESACSPSFLFASQRCNCRHQWDCSQELAAYANPIEAPEASSGHDFEQWVQSQITLGDNRVSFQQPGQGVLLIHIDTQNGMGSGYTPGEAPVDLYTRASLRHRGEYSAEQILGSSMSEAFHSIGIEPDPRHLDENIGYQTPFIAMDFLQTNMSLKLLSNNPRKWTHRLAEGYKIQPVPLVGEINLSGAEEAESRNSEFEHQDIGNELIDFDTDLERLIKELEL